MRSRKRQQQDIYFSSIHERLDGIDTIQEWDKPIKTQCTVSVSSGTPEEISAGIVPDYDRYLTYHRNRYKPSLNLVEGMSVWVDVTPELNENGELVMSEDEVTPTVPPDYKLKKILSTKRGIVDRFGITKIGNGE